MSPQFKNWLVSSLNTFLADFIVALGAFFANGVEIEWTLTFWTGVAVVVIRSALRAFTKKSLPSYK